MSRFPLQELITSPLTLQKIPGDQWEQLFDLVVHVPATLSLYLLFAPPALPVLPTLIDRYINILPPSKKRGKNILVVALRKRQAMLTKIVEGRFDKTNTNIYTQSLLEQMIAYANDIRVTTLRDNLKSHKSRLTKRIERTPKNAFPIPVLLPNLDIIPDESWTLLLDDIADNPTAQPLLRMFTQLTLPETESECELYTNILYSLPRERANPLLQALEKRKREIHQFVMTQSDRSACEDRNVEKSLRKMQIHLSVLDDTDSETKRREEKNITLRLENCEVDGNITDLYQSEEEEKKHNVSVFPITDVKTVREIEAIPENDIRDLIQDVADLDKKDDNDIFNLMFTANTKPITNLECSLYAAVINRVDRTATDILQALELLGIYMDYVLETSIICNERFDRSFLMQVRDRLVALDVDQETAPRILKIDKALEDCVTPVIEQESKSSPDVFAQPAPIVPRSREESDFPAQPEQSSEDEPIPQPGHHGRKKIVRTRKNAPAAVQHLVEDAPIPRRRRQNATLALESDYPEQPEPSSEDEPILLPVQEARKKIVRPRKNAPAPAEDPELDVPVFAHVRRMLSRVAEPPQESDEDDFSEDESSARLLGNTTRSVNDTDTSKPLVPLSRMKKFFDDYIRAMGGHEGQRKFPVNPEFLKNVNLRLYEWVRDVMSLLKYTQQPTDSSPDDQKCQSLVIGPRALKEAIKLTNPNLELLTRELTLNMEDAFDVQVPEPTKKYLANAMLFYAHPLRQLRGQAYKIMSRAFSERLVYLARTVWNNTDATGWNKLAICPSLTTLGRVPHNKVEAVNFHAPAKTMNVAYDADIDPYSVTLSSSEDESDNNLTDSSRDDEKKRQKKEKRISSLLPGLSKQKKKKEMARTKQTARRIIEDEKVEDEPTPPKKKPSKKQPSKKKPSKKQPSKKKPSKKQPSKKKSGKKKPSKKQPSKKKSGQGQPAQQNLSLQSLAAIGRLTAQKLVAAMLSNRRNLSSIFNPTAVPITVTEIDAYIVRVQKLRIPAEHRDFLLVKTGMLNYLQRRRDQLAQNARDGFQHETDENNTRALDRLRAIGGQGSDEYAGRMRRERHEYNEDFGDFFVDDLLFDNDDVQGFLNQPEPVSEQDEAFFNMVNWRLHEWLQSVFAFLPVAAVPLRARGAANSCASSTLEESKLRVAIGMDNPEFARQDFQAIIDTSAAAGNDVPEPNEVNLRKAMLFYVAPITTISPASFALMKLSLMAHFVQLVKTLQKFRKHEGNFTVCDSKTNAGKISQHVERHNFKANADTLDVYGIELASGDESEPISSSEDSSEESSEESDTTDDDDLGNLSFGQEEDWW